MVINMEDKLSQILSSPESMQKIAEIAKSLAGSGQSPQQKAEGEAGKEPAAAPENAHADGVTGVPAGETAVPAANILSSLPDIGGIINGLDISPDFIKSIGRAAEGFNGNEKRITLLNAFKPFAHGNNTDTINRAILALKIARAARLFMAGQ